MGIRTNFYKVVEVKDQTASVGKFTFIENWLKDHYDLSTETDLTLSDSHLDKEESDRLLTDILLVLNMPSKEAKKQKFNELFKEDYTEYETWFDDVLDYMEHLAEYLQKVEDNETVVIMAY